jgi:uncharacterized membrane protein
MFERAYGVVRIMVEGVPRMRYSERTIEINAPPERVFDLVSDFEDYPRWMANITEVRYTGRRHTRWVVDSRYGESVAWEAETIAFEPDHRVAWQSVRGDIRTDGEVIIEETRRGTTWLRVVIGFEAEDARDDEAFRTALGDNPGRQLEENLERLTYLAEGRRRRRPSREEPVYERSDRSERVLRFERALRDARREQDERRRRYEETRDRDEVGRYRETANLREANPESRRDPEQPAYYYPGIGPRMEAIHREPPVDEEEIAARRYALTPREREDERDAENSRQRSDNHEQSRRIMRRGVDRLMDKPPSARWDQER